MDILIMEMLLEKILIYSLVAILCIAVVWYLSFQEEKGIRNC